MPSFIDLRSDTVTRPSPGMRKAMAEAEVGDDIFGEDPSVNALEERVAELFGKDAAIFVSSGTMGNQLAIACQTRPGDEVIVGDGAHPQHYEAGASPVLSGVQFAVAGKGGTYTETEMRELVRPHVVARDGNYAWLPRSSLVCVENTHNRAGGRVFAQTDVIAIGKTAQDLGLAYHLDGARIWNASVATKMALAALAAPFDTVSVCFSKGLGAPVGSALLGKRATIRAARRFRKMWGGGMRQSGILAAAATYALTHNVTRLAEDHANAKAFAERLRDKLALDLAAPETNIVMVDVPVAADEVSAAAKERGLLINSISKTRLRAVTHLDVSRQDVERAGDILAEAVAWVKANPGAATTTNSTPSTEAELPLTAEQRAGAPATASPSTPTSTSPDPKTP